MSSFLFGGYARGPCSNPSSWTLLSWLFSWPPLTMQAGLSSMSPCCVGWSPEAAPVIPKNASACIHSLPIYCLLGAVHCLEPHPHPQLCQLQERRHPAHCRIPRRRNSAWSVAGRWERGNPRCSLQNEGHVTPQAPFAKLMYVLLSFSMKSPFGCASCEKFPKGIDFCIDSILVVQPNRECFTVRSKQSW